MTDYRDLPKWRRFIIDLKWKMRKNTGGPRGLIMIVLIMAMVMMVLNLVVGPMLAPKVEILKPACQTVCDIPL